MESIVKYSMMPMVLVLKAILIVYARLLMQVQCGYINGMPPNLNTELMKPCSCIENTRLTISAVVMAKSQNTRGRPFPG